MMKSVLLIDLVANYLQTYVKDRRNLRSNTISSYEDSLILLLKYFKELLQKDPLTVTIQDLTLSNLMHYLNWIESSRGCKIATRNLRLTGVKSFILFLLEHRHLVRYFSELNLIKNVKVKGDSRQPQGFLSKEGIELLFKQVDQFSLHGRRDLFMLSTMYEGALRVGELANLTPEMISYSDTPILSFNGKGGKYRHVPLIESTENDIKRNLQILRVGKDTCKSKPIFHNSNGIKLHRNTINMTLKKYADKARDSSPDLVPERVTCHTLRRSRAMHLIQGGLNIVYLRDFLGHSSIKTTGIYLENDTTMLESALQNANLPFTHKNHKFLNSDFDFAKWLRGLK